MILRKITIDKIVKFIPKSKKKTKERDIQQNKKIIQFLVNKSKKNSQNIKKFIKGYTSVQGFKIL